jgi:hypothetical protein
MAVFPLCFRRARCLLHIVFFAAFVVRCCVDGVGIGDEPKARIVGTSYNTVLAQAGEATLNCFFVILVLSDTQARSYKFFPPVLSRGPLVAIIPNITQTRQWK